MKKKISSGFLALVFLLQAFLPSFVYANQVKPQDTKLISGDFKGSDNVITIGKLKGVGFSKDNPTASISIEEVKEKSHKNTATLDGLEIGDEIVPQALRSSGSPYIQGQQPADPDKPKYWANVQGELTTRGIDGTKFDWDKVLGKGTKVKLLFTQTNGIVMTGVTYSLLVDKDGTYTWQGSDGKPTYLPLYDVNGNPYTYNVQIERNYDKNVQLIVQESNSTPSATWRPEGDKQVATIQFLNIEIQQVASTKFVSEWHTSVAEGDRPQIEGYFEADTDVDNDFNFPLNNTDETILRDGFLKNFEEGDEENGPWSFLSSELETTPKTVEVKTNTAGLTFKEEDGVKIVTSGDHKFKYDFTYDVIKGGKLTMTEVIPVTFDANGGKFASITDSAAKQEIKKEVEYDGTLTDLAEEPTKENESFKGWSLTKNGEPLSDVDLNKAIKNIKEAKTFYAIYGKASAKISYLDLDGKAIDDKFKFGEIEYPVDKEGKAGTVVNKAEYTENTAPKFIGYKFNRVELNPTDAKYAFENQATIKIYYEKLPDVIPAKDGSGNQNEKPDGYVEVKFVPTDKAKDQVEKIFYVNPKKDVTIPIANPEAIATYTFKEWKMGANADGAVYKPSTAQKFTDDLTVITATYEETENIIPYDPSVPDPMVRPEGYVRVTFAADPGLKLTESKAYYVKAKAGITLGNDKLVKPGYSEETGYKFKEWDKEDKLEITDADILVTAKATKLDNVIPEKDNKGNPNTKPDGYKEVTFVIKTDDAAKGSIEGVTKFYVNPTEYVKINPPSTSANTGYEFGAWDKDATIPTVYKEDAKITGSFNDLKAVIPKTNPDGSENKQPAGYKTVTFVIDPATGGKIADGAVSVYYVNPAKEVTVSQPKTAADTGYVFEKWDKDTTTAKMYTTDTTVKGNFKKLDDIIPSTDGNGTPNAKPEGYVTVTFDKGDHGKEITGQTVYYVNPKANPVKTLGDTSIEKPTVKAETGYKFTSWNFADTKEISSDITVTAQYEELKDIIPQEKTDGSDKPEGYITVTFVKGAHGKLTGRTVFYINPNKSVRLESYAPKVTADADYIFTGWDASIHWPIQYRDDDKITAQYKKDLGGDWQTGTLGSTRILTVVEKEVVKVPAEKTFRKEVRYMQGFNNYFRPTEGLTRAEAAQILANALVEDGYRYDPNFTIRYKDIVGNEWYAKAIRITSQANVFKGYDTGYFDPHKRITRAEWIGTLRRFQELERAPGNHMQVRPDHWAMGEIEAAYKEGWLAIYGQGLARFNADEFIPRQEVAAVSNKAFNRVLDKTYIHRNSKNLINYKDVNPSMWSYEDILCASNGYLHDGKSFWGHKIDYKKDLYNINLDGYTVRKDKFQRLERR